MKVVGIIQGISAYREILEEYAPEQHPPLSDVVQAVRNRYQFQQFPVFAPNMANQPTALTFFNGRFAQNDSAFAITQLVMTPKGDTAATSRTGYSDLVLDNLFELLDTQFKYRLRESSKKKLYWSHVVVEFEKGVEQYISKIGAIESIVNKHAKAEKAFRFKGASFSTTTSQLAINDPIDFLEAQEFVIERRVDVPFEQNRFFSSAPLSTEQHLKALEEIEEAIRN